ncbi:MAG: hypothetical protein SFZ03_03760 [Candidatus Melainabacteria bacterium]|nr:hypothetical protein [Candidatus Melainabacteria bacterium]
MATFIVRLVSSLNPADLSGNHLHNRNRLATSATNAFCSGLAAQAVWRPIQTLATEYPSHQFTGDSPRRKLPTGAIALNDRGAGPSSL